MNNRGRGIGLDRSGRGSPLPLVEVCLDRSHFAFFHGGPLGFGFHPGFLGGFLLPHLEAALGAGGPGQEVVEVKNQ